MSNTRHVIVRLRKPDGSLAMAERLQQVETPKGSGWWVADFPAGFVCESGDTLEIVEEGAE